VGAHTDGSNVRLTLVERWNGKSWSIQKAANPRGSHDNGLFAVSCTSANACTAVGDYTNSSNVALTLVERWNGTSWSIQKTPNPGGSVQGLLNGVSCTSPSDCLAVGYYDTGTSGQYEFNLAERWNGTSWSIQKPPSPDPTGLDNLNWVSCTSASACKAVGAYTNSLNVDVTLAEHWNGTSWSEQKTANPKGSTGAFLSGVSCISVSDCIAVGNYYNGSNVSLTLAEHWNGTSWSIQRRTPGANVASRGWRVVASRTP
jgi:hypothetical protein